MFDDRSRPQVIKLVAAGGANDLIAVKGFRLPDDGLLRIDLDMKPKRLVQKRHAAMKFFAVAFTGRKARMKQLMGDYVKQRGGIPTEKKMPAEREPTFRVIGPRDIAGAVFTDAARNADSSDLAKAGGESRPTKQLFYDGPENGDQIPRQQALFPYGQVAREPLLHSR